MNTQTATIEAPTYGKTRVTLPDGRHGIVGAVNHWQSTARTFLLYGFGVVQFSDNPTATYTAEDGNLTIAGIVEALA
jgi:hypothetical protein